MSKRRLFELTTEDGCSISHYVWRTKFALARKNLPYDTETVGFTKIAAIGNGSFRSLPVLQDSGKCIGGSCCRQGLGSCEQGSTRSHALR